MKCLKFADLPVTVETTKDITLCRPMISIFPLKVAHFIPSYRQLKDTNLMQPGGASVQGEDVTECRVRRFLHWGCWHITYSDAWWSREQIEISSSYFVHLRREMRWKLFFGAAQTRGVSSCFYLFIFPPQRKNIYWQPKNGRASWWQERTDALALAGQKWQTVCCCEQSRLNLETWLIWLCFGKDILVTSLTKLSGWLDVNVIIATANSDNDAQSFKLFQVFSHQGNGVVHQSSYGFIQHLDTQTHKQQVMPWAF